MDINLYHYFPSESEILSRLDSIQQKLDLILRVERRTENEMQLDFTNMIAAAADQSTVTNSVLQTLKDLGAKIADLSAQLATAIAASDPAATAAIQTQLDALATGIQTNDAALAAAIATPGPAPTPTSAPTPIPVV